MHDTQHSPSPQLFFDTATAYQRTAALKAAVELDVFTAIAEGADDAAAIAARCQAAPRGVRILCDYLTILGFLTKEDGRLRLTVDSAIFLDRRSPAFMGSVLDFICSPNLVEHFSSSTEAVRRGGAADARGTLAPDDPVWVRFARAMVPMTVMPAQAMAEMAGFLADRPGARVLDVAAGHGMYGIAVARRYPGVEVVAVDWQPVLELARAHAASAGVADRYHTRPGSAFDVDLGGDYELILLTNFLHHFDATTCEVLLRRVHAALRPGGQVFTLDMVPEPDRVNPPPAAGFAFTMLNSTPAGDAYTFAELERMFQGAGFTRNAHHRLPGGMQSVIVSQT